MFARERCQRVCYAVWHEVCSTHQHCPNYVSWGLIKGCRYVGQHTAVARPLHTLNRIYEHLYADFLQHFTSVTAPKHISRLFPVRSRQFCT
jgi:hypothetical protein